MHPSRTARRALVLVLVLPLIAGSTYAAQPATDGGKVLKGKAAFDDWHGDAPGVRRLITLQGLPAPSADKPNEVEKVPMPAGAVPKVPAGFKVELVVSGLEQPRVIRTAPNGDLFIAESKAGQIRVLRMPTEKEGGSGDGKPSENAVFAKGLTKPYGIAFHPPGAPTWVYVATPDGVVRYPYTAGDLESSSPAEKVVQGLPVAHHWTRDIAFSLDGTKMFLAVGSGSNIALDMFPKPREPEGGLEAWNKIKPLGAAWDTEDRRACVLAYDPDGKNERIFATGLRNPSGIAVHPTTGELWSVVNERDGLGDDTPVEYATRVREGKFYGWPWFYNVNQEETRLKEGRPDLKGKVETPDVLLQPHTAPLQIAFYNSASFPAEYKGSAFVTMHGSWDRSRRIGYKVVRMIADSAGNFTGEVEDFMTGFVVSDKQVWGRPVGVTVGKDGSLFVTEDGKSGTVWRVSYTGN